jgi:hypothetical protein
MNVTWMLLRPAIKNCSRIVLGLALACSLFLTACKSKPASQNEVNAPPANRLELIFTYGSEKEKWINEVTAEFNRGEHRTASGKRIWVQAIPMGSGEAIDEAMEGRRQPHIISGCLADYRNPVPLDTLEYQIRLAVAEASDLEFVPQQFRTTRPDTPTPN